MTEPILSTEDRHLIKADVAKWNALYFCTTQLGSRKSLLPAVGRRCHRSFCELG